MIHETRYALAQLLSVISNKAIENYTFPDKWKRARIVPVHKKNDISDLKNYRPIAIISNFAKIFEQMIYKSITNNVRPYISQNQHGFLPGKSTTINLITITQSICEQVDVVYTEFSSAFDAVDHGILLRKLSSFGLTRSFISLVESYLSDRVNYVTYNGSKSKQHQVFRKDPKLDLCFLSYSSTTSWSYLSALHLHTLMI